MLLLLPPAPLSSSFMSETLTSGVKLIKLNVKTYTLRQAVSTSINLDVVGFTKKYVTLTHDPFTNMMKINIRCENISVQLVSGVT